MTDNASSSGNPDQGSNPPPPPTSGSGQPGPEETVIRPADSAQGDVLVDNAPAPAPASDVAGGAGDGGGRSAGADGIDPEFPTRAGKAGATSLVVPVGTGLLSAAVLISAFRSRSSEAGDLDWSNYGIGLGAVAVLLVVALLGASLARRVGGRAREEAVTWPGVAGILGTAVMIGTGIDSDDKWVGYLIGGVIVALAIVGYLLARRPAFTLIGFLGLALIYALLFDDLIADSVDDDNVFLVSASAVAVFVVGASLLGWLLPGRAVTGVALGAFAVAAYVGMLLALVAIRFLGDFFGGVMGMGMGMGDDGDPFAMAGEADAGFPESDVWWILAFAGVLTVLWAIAAAITNHSGFSILAIVMPALTVPLATVALAAEHPSRWSAIVAAAGGVLLLGGIALARGRARATDRELPVGPTG